MYKGILFSFCAFLCFSQLMAADKEKVCKNQLSLVQKIIITFLEACGSDNNEAQGLLVDMQEDSLKDALEKAADCKLVKDFLMRTSAALFETEDRRKIQEQDILIKQLQSTIRALESKLGQYLPKSERSPSTEDRLAQLQKENNELKNDIDLLRVQCRSLLGTQTTLYQTLSTQIADALNKIENKKQ